MDKTVMKPIKKWHTNDVLRGWDGDKNKDPVSDLPITRLPKGQGVVSVWRVKSIWQRIKFLLHGQITFQVISKTHPPISIYCSDVMVRQK